MFWGAAWVHALRERVTREARSFYPGSVSERAIGNRREEQAAAAERFCIIFSAIVDACSGAQRRVQRPFRLDGVRPPRALQAIDCSE